MLAKIQQVLASTERTLCIIPESVYHACLGIVCGCLPDQVSGRTVKLPSGVFVSFVSVKAPESLEELGVPKGSKLVLLSWGSATAEEVKILPKWLKGLVLVSDSGSTFN